MFKLLCILLAFFVCPSAYAKDLLEAWGDWMMQDQFTPHFQPYVAAGYSHVHHTGYGLNPTVATEHYENGAVAVIGTSLTPRVSVELAYHYLNKAPLLNYGSLFVNSPTGSENSYAVAGSFLGITPLIPFPFESVPVRLYARAGVDYKHISESIPGAALLGLSTSRTDSGFSYVIGGGVEVHLTKLWFARFEYEYLAKIGTKTAINVQHTPLTAVLGYRF